MVSEPELLNQWLMRCLDVIFEVGWDVVGIEVKNSKKSGPSNPSQKPIRNCNPRAPAS